MTKTIIAASILALSAFAVPAFASEEYQYGPARPISSEVATRDTGSAQYPTFDGEYGRAPMGQVALGNASSATVETPNSAPQGALVSVFPGAVRSTR